MALKRDFLSRSESNEHDRKYLSQRATFSGGSGKMASRCTGNETKIMNVSEKRPEILACAEQRCPEVEELPMGIESVARHSSKYREQNQYYQVYSTPTNAAGPATQKHDQNEPRRFSDGYYFAAVDPRTTTSDYHSLKADEALAYMKHLARETSLANEWKRVLKIKSGLEVCMYRPTGGSKREKEPPVFRGEAIIKDFTPQAIFYVIGNRQLWDEWYEDGHLLENLNERTSLTYEALKGSALLRPRDVALVETVEYTQQGGIYFASTSVETPKAPRRNGHIRARVRLAGWVLEPNSDDPIATKVTYFLQEEIKGWIPKFAAKRFLARRALVIEAINSFLVTKGAVLRASRQPQIRPNSYHLGGSTEPPALTLTTEHVPSTQIEKNAETSSKSDQGRRIRRSLSMSSLGHPSSSKRSIASKTATARAVRPSTAEKKQSAHQSTTKASGSSASQRHRHSNIASKAMEALKSYSLGHDDWIFQRDCGGVRLYTRESDNLVRGESIVQGSWTAEQVAATIFSAGARKIWDRCFVDGVVIEHFGSKELLFLQKMKNLVPNGVNKVLTIVSFERDTSTGTIYIASSSVNDESVAISPSIHIELDGWIIRPSTAEKGLSTSIEITRIVKWALPADHYTLSVDYPANCAGKVADFLRCHGYPPYARRVAGRVLSEIYRVSSAYEFVYTVRYAPLFKGTGWYTELRLAGAFPHGYDAQITPDPREGGLRVELSPDSCGLRIFVADESLDGRQVFVRVKPSTQEKKCINGIALVAPADARRVSSTSSNAANNHRSPPETPSEQIVSVPSRAKREVSEEEAKRNTSIGNAGVNKDAGNQSWKRLRVLTSDTLVGSEQEEPVKEKLLDKLPFGIVPSDPPLPQIAAAEQSTGYKPESVAVDSIRNPFLKTPSYGKKRRINATLILGEDLTLNAKELLLFLFGMLVCYYMGKISCQTT
ncbi:uncharacterized protein VTP21DRAFT_7862 [Calcarisporiella thermophila]|uniref:uncharacterized protein n=1 Tax=Calcarisporiella thermophila TaxID=911321 RepID=UPI003744300A